jgi:hypothetical protein
MVEKKAKAKVRFGEMGVIALILCGEGKSTPETARQSGDSLRYSAPQGHLTVDANRKLQADSAR